MAELQPLLDGSGSFFGLDSFSDPQALERNEYVASMNTVSRGGIVQTRPGTRVTACAPTHDNPQGFYIFQPTGGVTSHVLAVDGYVYVSQAPFAEWTRLEGIAFSPQAKYVSFVTCLQSTDYDKDGVLFPLAAPKSVLVMQDGQTRAAYWDGNTARHLNPTQSTPTTLWVTAAVIASNGTFVQSWSSPVDLASGDYDAPTAYGTDTVRVRYLRSDTLPSAPTDPEGTGWSVDIPEPGTKEGFDETKIGLWMEWSNNRLWVAKDGQVFASDIGNPLKFTESQYLNEGRAFYLPDDCTGMVELSDQSGILVFTSDTGTLIRSSITDRTQWLNTPDFQKLILPKIGCVAPRSIEVQYGLIWWFSTKGITSLDAALRQNITSKLLLQDMEVMGSKSNLSPDLSMICGAFYENYLLMSVPSGDVWNRHTWVLDQDPFPASGVSANSWNSWWMGWRPVEWARAIVDGNERLFFLSKDYDGKCRVWEAMLPERTDNGCPITCALQTREHNFGNMEYKRFRYAEMYLKEVYGSVAMMAAYKSTKGGWTRVMTKQMEATAGQIYEDGQYSEAGNKFAGNRPQSRTLRTSEGNSTESTCQECGVEDDGKPAWVDRAFSLLMVWSGRAGIYGYRIFADPEPVEYLSGRCEADEEGPRSVADNGASGFSFFLSCEPFPAITGTGSFSSSNTTCGGTALFTANATSIISQTDADNKAACAALTKAQCYADGQCGEPSFCNVEQTVTASVDCGNGIRVCDGALPVSSVCVSRTGSASLCGISGYDDGSVATNGVSMWNGRHRKWGKRALSISYIYDYTLTTYSNFCGVGAAVSTDVRFNYLTGDGEPTRTCSTCGTDGEVVISASTGPAAPIPITCATLARTLFVNNATGTIVGNQAIIYGFATEVTGTYDRTLTTERVEVAGSDLGCFSQNISDQLTVNYVGTGVLQDEVTAYQSLVDAGGAVGSSCVSEVSFLTFAAPESISAIPFTGTAVQQTFTIGSLLLPLTIGDIYTAIITLTKTPSGGGEAVTEVVNISFEAEANIDTLVYTLPAEQGFSIIVSNIEVLAGDIPCDGAVSSSFTVPECAFTARSQVQADRLAYDYALAQATAAAQAQLECIYGNEAQSYTATCPGALVLDGVVPPGSAIGNPVTVAIPAGTYTADTVAEANALALADATEQATDALDCFWTNTEQSATYCCEFIPDRCASATVVFNTYNSAISQMDADTLALAAALAQAESLVDCTSDTSDGGGEAIEV